MGTSTSRAATAVSAERCALIPAAHTSRETCWGRWWIWTERRKSSGSCSPADRRRRHGDDGGRSVRGAITLRPKGDRARPWLVGPGRVHLRVLLDQPDHARSLHLREWSIHPEGESDARDHPL